MPQHTDRLSASERDHLAMRRLVMNTFSTLLRDTELAPMQVLEYAAAAIGSVYREMADAHAWPRSCPCGWEPDELHDIAVLQAAIAGEALPKARYELASAPVAGHG